MLPTRQKTRVDYDTNNKPGSVYWQGSMQRVTVILDFEVGDRRYCGYYYLVQLQSGTVLELCHDLEDQHWTVVSFY